MVSTLILGCTINNELAMNANVARHWLRACMITILALSLSSCGISDPAEEGPNEMGGDPNLELTEVGQRFGAHLEVAQLIPGGFTWEDDITVIKNDGGIVTMNIAVKTDYKVLEALDTLFGTSGLPRQTKLQILDAVVRKFGATIDTSVAGTIRVNATPRFKITSSGIQEFVSSGGDLSKPFTIIKYDANVGDAWTFTRPDGKTVTRTVTYHSTTDDYPVAFWKMKVFKTESVEENDPVIQKIVYVTNHKYGTVGVHVFTTSGKELVLGVLPSTL